MAGYIFILVSALLFSLPQLSFQQCSSSEDVGRVHCGFADNQHQWVTCLRNDYIELISNDQHQCLPYIDPASQCYYQCMLQIYNMANGTFNEHCRCAPGDVLPRQTVVKPECYSPSATDCNWYKDCLETKYHCYGTNDGYAIEFIEKFCKLGMESGFSSNGRQWISGVLECLQSALLPSLKLWMSTTCASIRNTAFNNYSHCYAQPSLGARGICTLDCRDVLRAFAVVNFIKNATVFTAPIETINQMLSVIGDCFTDEDLADCIPEALTSLQVTTAVDSIQNVNNILAIASQTTHKIAQLMNWESNGIRWFPFVHYNSSNQQELFKIGNITFNVMLVDAKILNLHKTGGGKNLDQTLATLAHTIDNENLTDFLIIVSNHQVISRVVSVSQCYDALCSSLNITELETAQSYHGGMASLHYLHMTMYCAIITAFIIATAVLT